MTTENLVPNATRIQLLVPNLTLDDVEDAVLKKLTYLGRAYKSRDQWGTPGERQDAFSKLIATAYNISRICEGDIELYERLKGYSCQREEGQQDPQLAEIFESVLIYSLASKSTRWRRFASKLARKVNLSKEGLSSDDFVSRLEDV